MRKYKGILKHQINEIENHHLFVDQHDPIHKLSVYKKKSLNNKKNTPSRRLTSNLIQVKIPIQQIRKSSPFYPETLPHKIYKYNYSHRKSISVTKNQLNQNRGKRSCPRSSSNRCNSGLSSQTFKCRISRERRNNSVENLNKTFLEAAHGFYRENKIECALKELEKCEKNNPQAMYIKGLCKMKLCDYKQSSKHFRNLIMIYPTFKKQIYLLCAISLKKQHKLFETQQVVPTSNQLKKAIHNFDNYIDAYLMLGKLLMKMEKFQEAKQKYQKVLKLNPQNKVKLDCLIILGYYSEAIQFMISNKFGRDINYKMGFCQYHLQHYKQALEKFLECKDQNNSSLYIGLCYVKLNDYLNATIYLEKVLRDSQSKDAIICAFEYLVQIFLNSKDFYEAMYLIERTKYMQFQEQDIMEWKLLVQGCYNIIKKNIDEGIKHLSALQTRLNKLSKQKINFFKPLLYEFRGYAYFCSKELSLAYDDYDTYHSIFQSKVSDQVTYNIYLLEGLLQYELNFYKKAQDKFKKCHKLLPNKSQPIFYMAIILINQYTSNLGIGNFDQQKLEQALEYIIKAVQNIKSNSEYGSEIYFHKSIVEGFLNKWKQAFASIEMAIEMSDQNIAEHFFLRGIILGTLGQYKQAINQFNLAININENYAEAYLQKAKCFQQIDQFEDAFHDLQKYINLKPDESEVHKYVGLFLYINGAYEDSLCALQNKSIKEGDIDIIETRAKAYLKLGEYKKSMQYTKQLQKLTKLNSHTVDINIIQLLEEFKNNQYNWEKAVEMIDSEGIFFKKEDILLLRGCFYFYLNKFKIALQYFNESKIIREKNINADSFRQQENEQSFALLQVKFNIILTYLVEKDIEKAQIELINFRTNDQPILKKLQTFRKFVFKGEKVKYNQFEIFKTHQLEYYMSDYFPLFKVQVKNEFLVTNFNQEMRLSVSYPIMQSPALSVQLPFSLIDQFNCLKLQMRPQAPWLRKRQQMMIFTQQLKTISHVQFSKRNKEKKIDNLQL